MFSVEQRIIALADTVGGRKLLKTMTTLLISHTTTNQTTKQKHLWISSKVTSSFNLFTLFKQQDFVATSFAIIQTQISLNQYVLSPVILLKIDKNLFFQ